jgi:hypothetical protein
MLHGPGLDLALALASAALALTAALHAAWAGWPNATALCVTGLLGGLFWAHSVLPLALRQARGRRR